MNIFDEYALLVAVAIPLLLIAALNMFLVLTGERGTLLLPLLPEPLAIPELPAGEEPAPVDVQPAKAAEVPRHEPANEVLESEVA
jgi:hypothetical protein